MSVLYLDATLIAERRRVVAPANGPLAPLADSLARDLAPVIARPVWIPPEKARFTCAGGTCPRDGTRLAFDPFTPRAHRCPVCGTVYDRDEDYAWWIMGYQLWLAERAVHAAALALLRDSSALGAFAARVLDVQTDAYLTYRNIDNVLGPTRPFFSTYLESLWLVHICTALDLLQSAEPGRHDALAGRVLEKIVEPSRALITSFPEGTSNRQVWHAVARLAAARMLGDVHGARDAVHGAHGIAALLRTALLPDGSWYEGDNYHQFAHRGFWYALRVAARAGIEIAPDLVERFGKGHEVPFRVALPDDTLPARRDSQYAVSLRQWRWAEWCELGLAECLTRSGDVRLGAALARLYAPADPPLPHHTGRWRATGESERNEPASALSRADLGWKSLLFATPELPVLPSDAVPRSALLPEQGYAVLRRDGGRVYAALDFGGGGGGHGHPDRLNVILQDGAARWLDDPGTGTYVERTLHWYRSTLAHAAPLINGRSQDRGTEGTLSGFDPGPDPLDVPRSGLPGRAPAFAGVAAHATIAPARVARALIADDAYVVDLLTWRAAQPCIVDLPFPVDGRLVGRAESWMPFEPGGGGGLEDGFDFVRNAEAMRVGDHPLRLALSRPNGEDGAGATLWLIAPEAILWRAVAPGPPGTGERRFHALRLQGDAGAVIAVWDLRGTITAVRTEGAADTLLVARADGSTDRHVAPDGARLDREAVPNTNGIASPLRAPGAQDVWRVERRDTAGRIATQALALGVPSRERSAGERTALQTRSDAAREADRGPRLLLTDGTPLTFALGETHYRRSEEVWHDAGAPRATVRLSIARGVLTVEVDVQLGRAPVFVPPGAINPLDNERADVNSDGLQLLVDIPAPPAHAAVSWLLVPERPAPAVRQTRTSGNTPAPALTATWRERADGWAVTIRLPLAGLAAASDVIALDLAVNERPPGRERRRGQLLLSEPDSPFVYLRGDRMDASRALRFQLPSATPALSLAHMPSLLDHVRVVLYEPQKPINIAATVRAMKNMGVGELRLVRPCAYDANYIEVIAHHTRDIADRITHFDTLGAALADCVRVAAFTGRRRAAKWPIHTPREAAADLATYAADGPVAVLFGREDDGLPADAIDRAHFGVTIPTTAHASLNVAQAVLVALYELHLVTDDATVPLGRPRRHADPPTTAQFEEFFGDTQRALTALDFFRTRSVEHVMRGIRSLVFRASPDERELGLTRAIAFEILRTIERERARAYAAGLAVGRDRVGADTGDDAAAAGTPSAIAPSPR